MIVQQNKWRAARYGLDAQLVDSFTFKSRPAREVLTELVDLLIPTAERLGCLSYLERVKQIAARPTWADRQLQLREETNDAAEVVRRLTEKSRLNSARVRQSA